MTTAKQIVQDKMHKEIERIKDKIYKETRRMTWKQLRSYFDDAIKEFYGSSWRGNIFTHVS